MKEKLRDKLFLRWIPLILINIFVLMPILWTIVTSLKRESDILEKPIKYIPDPITFENYIHAWKNCKIDQYYLNSMKVSLIAVFFIVIIAIMVGYALSRFQFKGKSLFMLALLGCQFIPTAAMMIPLFKIFNQMGLIGTHAAVIIACISLQFPFNSILMRGFVSGIPYELEEAAQIDGCSRLVAVVKVVLPLLVPGIIATAAFAFVGVWNEYLLSMMFLNDPSTYTIPIGLRMMQGEYSVNYGVMSAGATIAITVPLLLFAYLQKHLVTGVGAGAVKG